MKKGIDIRLGVSFAIIVVLLMYTTYLSIRNNTRYYKSIQHIQSINLLMMELSNLHSQTSDLIGAYRGYALTGTQTFRDDYERTRTSLAETLQHLNQYKSDSIQLNIKLDTIKSLTLSLEAFAQLAIIARETSEDAVEKLLSTQKGLQIKKELDSAITSIESYNRGQLRILENNQLNLTARANSITYSVVAFSFILISILFYLLNQEFSYRKIIAQQLNDLNTTLEVKVKEQTTTLVSIFDRISDGFVALDKNWKYTYMNIKAGEITRRDPKKVIGKKVLEVFPELINTSSFKVYQEAMDKQQPAFHVEYLDFLNSWVESSVYPSENGLTIFFRDITTQIKDDEQKKELQLRFESIFNSTHDAIVLADNALHLVQCNPAASEILGYSPEELTTMGIIDIVMDDQQAFVLEVLWPEFQQKKKLEGSVLLKRKDAQGIFCQFKATAHILPGLHLAVFTDVTSQKKAETDLLESEEKYRYLFENNPMPMWLVDSDSLRFIDVNEASVRHYGYSKHEFMNLRITDIVLAEERNPNETIYQPYKAGDLYKGIRQHRLKDGNQITVEKISHSVTLAGHNAKLVLIKDITEQIKVEENLRLSNQQLKELTEYLHEVREKERTRIAREIHDELGQQLTGLKMDAAWISKNASRYDKPLQDKINEMMLLTDETISIIRRIAADLRPGILDDFGLVAALEWQSKEFEKRAGIHCTFTSAADDLEVSADLSTNLFRIYQEALTNVARHAQATAISASIEKKNQQLILKIQDNGNGFNINKITTSSFGLIGMKERARIINAQLKISSEIGKGTTIFIEAPIA
jgi:PAS domain S-box-containing protein